MDRAGQVLDTLGRLASLWRVSAVEQGISSRRSNSMPQIAPGIAFAAFDVFSRLAVIVVRLRAHAASALFRCTQPVGQLG